MSTPLRVLIVEDRPGDAELMVYELNRFGFEPQWKRVETEAEYLAELAIAPDVILADHSLPQFSAPQALELLKKSGLDIPFIVITGSISEEVAVERIKQGAADYILKDRMARLPSAVEHALKEKKLQDEKRRSDTSLRESEARKGAILDSALDCIITMDHQGRIVEFNPAAERTFGYARAEAIGRDMAELIIPPSFREKHRHGLTRYLATGEGPVIGNRLEITAIRSGGSEFPVELSILRIPGSDPPMFTGFIRDITERKRTEEEVQRNLQRIRALHDIDVAIGSTLDLPSILDVLLEKIDLFFAPAAASTIRLVNKENGELEPVACRNLDEAEWKAATAKVLGGVGRMLPQDNAVLAVRNAQMDRRSLAPELLRKYGLLSFLRVPMLAKGDLLGMLTVFTKEEHEFTGEEIDFLVTLAGQAAIAIHNAQLYEKTVKADRVKTEFLSVMSHELRTPLSVVMGYTGLIKEGNMGAVTKEQKDALQKVLDRAGDQLAMINAIMQTTQLEARAITANNELLDLHGLLDQLRSDFEVRSDKKSVGLIWDYPAAAMPVVTDGPKIKQILRNLISNALKFTEEGTVAVSARIVEEDAGRDSDPSTQASRLPPPASRWVEFTVTDTGIGIAKERQQAIFEKFYQVDSSETRLFGGVGLGLYIVKNFTDLLGGKIELESAEGKGSTFTVKIPYES